MSKVTTWFPSHIKPVHIGWYDVTHSDFRWFFDGEYWCWFIGNDVKNKKIVAQCQDREWRGLAEKP